MREDHPLVAMFAQLIPEQNLFCRLVNWDGARSAASEFEAPFPSLAIASGENLPVNDKPVQVVMFFGEHSDENLPEGTFAYGHTSIEYAGTNEGWDGEDIGESTMEDGILLLMSNLPDAEAEAAFEALLAEAEKEHYREEHEAAVSRFGEALEEARRHLSLERILYILAMHVNS